jgi:hypothetical protein
MLQGKVSCRHYYNCLCNRGFSSNCCTACVRLSNVGGDGNDVVAMPQELPLRPEGILESITVRVKSYL